ncbi:methionyl-tRNA formyltransferase isoform X1 [Oryza brachyantha]|uniref:methionyl-tRNA formyltransferase isoform X1 n=1 Tax=Oryza brachyantha TaxID=4533 RepID=UPI001ADA1D7E|nr:methionyl-tRNA formyltransferase isoform X1 [Oryza brachyantha]
MARFSPPLLRRCLCSAAKSASAAGGTNKRNIVFLGSPQVAASVLETLLVASDSPDSAFQVAAVVTQPPAAKNRGRKLMPSAVAQLALDRGFPGDLIFTPERAGEEAFLSGLKELRPELCITAAYGNILPQRFLDIPPYGTVNIHPSLLPLYRGAAPVQRALQDGVEETGVSLAYTVRALDAGPVISCEKFSVDECIKAPELLAILFNIGSKLLLRELPSILDGSAKEKAKPQDDSKATHAPKLNSDESWLSFDQEAKVLHNKVRAFAGWPGTRAKLQLMNQNGEPDVLEIKVISTKVCASCDKTGDGNEVLFSGSSLLIPCSGSSCLEVMELQLPGKKVTTARDFWNGLRGQKLLKSP